MGKQKLKPVIEKAKVWMIQEFTAFDVNILPLSEIANFTSQLLAKKMKVDKDTVLLGTILSDIKLGECLREGKYAEHVKRSSDAAKIFLTENNVDIKTIKIIVSCIELHHGTKKYPYKEAEIVANADCYKFLSQKGIMYSMHMYAKRSQNALETVTLLESKMEEKYKIVSIPECKKELEPNYKYFKKIIGEMKK